MNSEYELPPDTGKEIGDLVIDNWIGNATQNAAATAIERELEHLNQHPSLGHYPPGEVPLAEERVYSTSIQVGDTAIPLEVLYVDRSSRGKGILVLGVRRVPPIAF